MLLYNTGLRISEALGLRHVDIDLAEKVIWVVPREDNANEARAKSGRTRGVPVHDYVLNMYVDYLTSDEYLPAFEAGAEYIKKIEKLREAEQLGKDLRWACPRWRSSVAHRTISIATTTDLRCALRRSLPFSSAIPSGRTP